MKKKLEADLISIAHRILKLKNKSDINQLYLETQKLYEKLTVLKFVDENFDEVKPTIGRGEVESKIETIFDKDEIIVPVKIETDEITSVEVEKTVIEPETVSEPKAAEENLVAIEETPEEIIPEPVAETIAEPIVEETQPPTATEKEEPIEEEPTDEESTDEEPTEEESIDEESLEAE